MSPAPHLRVTLAAGLLLLAAGFLSPAALPAAANDAASTPRPPVIAGGGAPEESESPGPAGETRQFTPRQGDITLGNDLAKLHVPGEFFFFGPVDTVNFLVRLGNPRPSVPPLGMIMPAKGPDNAEWFAVLSYEEDGYVSDKDADSIDYNAILKQMQEGVREESKRRVADGRQGLELLGWAEPPHYDKDSKKVYWAKDIQFAGEKDRTLNYNIRMLGRRGVLVLNCVADLAQIQEIRAASPQLLGMVEFNQGHRYVDFDPATDKTAAYGLAALVAGGIAAKAGLFKVLIAGIIAAKKFVIIGVLALAAFVKKLLSGGKTPDPGS